VKSVRGRLFEFGQCFAGWETDIFLQQNTNAQSSYHQAIK
jgi:hypothetical protein